VTIYLGIFCHWICFIKYNNLVRWAGITTEIHHKKKTCKEYKNRMELKSFLILMSLRFPCSTNSNSSKVLDFRPHHINSTIITSIELQNSRLIQLWTETSKEEKKTESPNQLWVMLFFFFQNKTVSNVISTLTRFIGAVWEHQADNTKHQLSAN